MLNVDFASHFTEKITICMLAIRNGPKLRATAISKQNVDSTSKEKSIGATLIKKRVHAETSVAIDNVICLFYAF